jgi:hypothetical protein
MESVSGVHITLLPLRQIHNDYYSNLCTNSKSKNSLVKTKYSKAAVGDEERQG